MEDDGAGINAEKVIQSAIKEGIITEEIARGLTYNESLQLIFRSGVSTSPLITDISGRGLGLAIVSDKIINLGGSVSLSSEPGKGSCFTLILPLTLATFRGVLVRMGEHFIMVPINSVEKVIRINKSGIHLAEKQETMLYENHHIPLFRMSDTLGFQSGKLIGSESYAYLIIISSGKKKIGFHIDEVIGEQEGIIKPLGGQLLNVRHLSGATVLGDGKVVSVIDAYELLDSVSKAGLDLSKSFSDATDQETPAAARILVAEDSLTSRSLLRNLLESAGYEVSTAVDGWEAFTLLKQGSFDLVVSDIEMPRMNGFELTSKIRSEPGMSSLPIVLVTALETAEDRQRGLEAGANAYIMKSSFEGSNLVSTIQRLI
ncbi:MAG: response regulator [Bacteroidetes bacterium]|nr:response regulator [Bacteroidota bacterium]